MAIIDTLIVFVVSLLIGAVGIYVGARLLTGRNDYVYAVVTALIASIVWSIVAFFLGWIPFLGPLLALLAYLAIINMRYPGGWGTAIAISLIAWVSSLAVLYVLALFGLTSFEAAGVLGT